MEWTDRGIVLSTRRHGEGGAVVSLLTAGHGRHAGLARGGASRRQRGLFLTGNEVTARWFARLEDQLGTFECELIEARAARVLDRPARLAALASACALIEAALPERHPYAAVHRSLVALLDALELAAPWGEPYVRFELVLLGELGFGLDLARCAATGTREDLAYVSPRSGRAVSAQAGAPYDARLLRLPRFLVRGANAPSGVAELREGMALTGHFLSRHLFEASGGRLPAARERLADMLADPRALD
jgi:DNA repair protein RecO (recombination protein O)